MDVKRYVNMGFVFVGLLAWICLSPLFAWVMELVSPTWDMALVGAEFRLSDVLGLVTAIAFTVWLFAKDDVYSEALAIGNELSKVTWPNWEDTRKSTIVVILVTLVIAVILGSFDFFWGLATGWIYGI
ncbi:MAG: preprotein translocase subunit SecE [Myxococcota bacterium]|nr:preprotein translocase subunit SecE [Myxococcota bacterium]